MNLGWKIISKGYKESHYEKAVLQKQAISSPAIDDSDVIPQMMIQRCVLIRAMQGPDLSSWIERVVNIPSNKVLVAERKMPRTLKSNIEIITKKLTFILTRVCDSDRHHITFFKT